jgi:hypothetical protein
MLYLILCYSAITCICLWVGLLFYSFLEGKKQSQGTIFHCLITGLIVLTSIAQWIVLIFPLTAVSLFFILLPCFLCTIFRRKRIREILFQYVNCKWWRNTWFVMSLICFSIMILVLNAGPTMMDDTDSYHIQMIKWIQEYGSVPGIANLHLRFGFNTSWFTSIGLFSYPVAGLNSYLALNGLLSIWFCYFMLQKIFILSYDGKFNGFSNLWIGLLVLLSLCFLNWPMIRGSSCNANYDFISTCCVIVLFVDLFDTQREPPVEWLIWPLYLFTVRIMNFPLLILSLVYIFRIMKPLSVKNLLLIILCGGFIIFPFLIRDIILSGYLIFPVYQLDLFSFDWKADKMKLVEISNYIKYFNRVNPMYQSMTITEKMNFPNWIPEWYKYLFRIDKLILTFSFIGYLYLLFSIKNKKDILFRIFFFTMICQLISWFFIGPDPRFAYGPLLFGLFAAINHLPRIKEFWNGFAKYPVLVISFLVLIYGFSKIVRDDEYRNFLTPRRLPVPAVRTIKVGDVQMYIPEKILNNWNPRCYDVELPCLYKQDPRLEARGKRIEDGFRLKYFRNEIFTGGEYKISE